MPNHVNLSTYVCNIICNCFQFPINPFSLRRLIKYLYYALMIYIFKIATRDLFLELIFQPKIVFWFAYEFHMQIARRTDRQTKRERVGERGRETASWTEQKLKSQSRKCHKVCEAGKAVETVYTVVNRQRVMQLLLACSQREKRWGKCARKN